MKKIDVFTTGNSVLEYSFEFRSRQFNQMTIDSASNTYKLLDFKTYLTYGMTLASPKSQGVVFNTQGYMININEPDQLNNLTAYLRQSVI